MSLPLALMANVAGTRTFVAGGTGCRGPGCGAAPPVAAVGAEAELDVADVVGEAGAEAELEVEAEALDALALLVESAAAGVLDAVELDEPPQPARTSANRSAHAPLISSRPLIRPRIDADEWRES